MLSLFDKYVHNLIDRRAGAGVAAGQRQPESDDRINASWPAYEAALEAAGVKYEAFQYPGTQHGFNNDTTPRYEPAAAKLAWQRTIGFFNRALRA